MSLAGDAEIRDNWPEDPWQLLAEWLPSNEDPARPVMTLATAADGIPDARTLLLSEWDEHGLYFHTDSRSR
uniref:pyridoxamine 5'-phosphate oxidase family protein n=1 Tax=Pseudolysinimonas sp. TaxID=2680009 RepID=UPI00286A4E7C